MRRLGPKARTAGQALFAVRALAGALLLALLARAASPWQAQLLAGMGMVSLCMALLRWRKSHWATLTIVLCSMAAATRYMAWRVQIVTAYLMPSTGMKPVVDWVLTVGLLGAELYMALYTLLRLVQIVAPLHRPPVELPEDIAAWPEVDVLVLTAREPLGPVMHTALAAANMDYPPTKLRIHLLDAGRREEFRHFAEEAGMRYHARDSSEGGDSSVHAAALVNCVLPGLSAPLLAIFNADHIPTRAFLQMTSGWFLRDERLGFLQTPQRFYSPDPFQRNLAGHNSIPEQGRLYCLLQEGADLWDAAAFRGTGAVVRREALMEAGGMAVGTDVEGIRTGLRMQAKGWRTAHLDLPVAASLPAETLVAHIGQQTRRACGFVRLLRVENPFLEEGLTVMQRLCRLHVPLLCLTAVPRLVFLGAPIVFFLSGRILLPGPWPGLIAFGLPYLVLQSLAKRRLQGSERPVAWDAIYQTVLAPHFVVPTLRALVDPGFDPSAKEPRSAPVRGSVFDGRIAAPAAVLLLLSLVSILFAPYRFFVTYAPHHAEVVLQFVWLLSNMVLLGIAAALAREQRQRRGSVRVPAALPIALRTMSGRNLQGRTVEMSIGGCSMKLQPVAGGLAGQLACGERVRVRFPASTCGVPVTATVAAVDRELLRLRFHVSSIAEHEAVTCALFSRADAWLPRDTAAQEGLAMRMARLIRLSLSGLHQVLRSAMLSGGRMILRPSTAVAAVLLVIALATGAAMPGSTIGADEVDARMPAAALPASAQNRLEDVQVLLEELVRGLAKELRIAILPACSQSAARAATVHFWLLVGAWLGWSACTARYFAAILHRLAATRLSTSTMGVPDKQVQAHPQ